MIYFFCWKIYFRLCKCYFCMECFFLKEKNYEFLMCFVYYDNVLFNIVFEYGNKFIVKECNNEIIIIKVIEIFMLDFIMKYMY